MPFLVRAGLRYDRWLETEGRAPNDFPADVITDLVTKGDQLSVFEMTDAISAVRITIAVAAGKAAVGHTSYAMFERAAVEAVGISVNKKVGGTIDSAVNGFHHDLDVGTAEKLIALAGVIARGVIEPILKDRVVSLLRAGFENGQLDHRRNTQLCDRVKAKVPLRETAAPPEE